MNNYKDFFNRRAEEVARDLLGRIIEVNRKRLKIVETEAYYNEKDPASRACQNGDLRKTMMMKPGTLLVYGVHNNWLINFVTGKEGDAEAVLLRAGEALNFKENCSGPGLLCKGLEIDKKLHKGMVGDELKLFDGKQEKFDINESKRIGVKQDLDKNLRFYIKNNKFVSKLR